MSKKDFIALADYIKTAHCAFTQEQLDVLAHFCQSRNSAFKRDRWLGYIKGENGPWWWHDSQVSVDNASEEHTCDNQRFMRHSLQNSADYQLTPN